MNVIPEGKMREIKFRAWDTQRKIMILDTGYPQTSFDGDTAPNHGMTTISRRKS